MSWTLHLRPILNPWTDKALVTCGRALYVAQAFESKCLELVRFGEIAGIVDSDPIIKLDDLIAQTPADQLLARTIARLGQLVPGIQPEETAALAAAREARNYIAHECALFAIHTTNVQSLQARMVRLRDEIASLAAGDNVVSTWLHQVTERAEATPLPLVVDYPRMIDDWVLGPVRLLVE